MLKFFRMLAESRVHHNGKKTVITLTYSDKIDKKRRKRKDETETARDMCHLNRWPIDDDDDIYQT